MPEPNPIPAAPTLDFAKAGGLLPGIVQDAATGQVLMLGFLNPESLDLTLSSGFVTFFSRTRSQLWQKGATSGNRLRVVEILTDCDRDTLLFRVFVEGDGLVCHEGTVSCFTVPLALSDSQLSARKSPSVTDSAVAQGAAR